MAPKKRSATKPKKKLVTMRISGHGSVATDPIAGLPITLTEAAMADLRYLEPTRTRQRVISMLNELYAVVLELQRAHAPKPL